MELVKALRLYFIPDPDIGLGVEETIQAELALKGGVTAIQLRFKQRNAIELFHIGQKLRDITVHQNALLIVNDRVDIALSVRADGVHVGQSDLPVSIIRNTLAKNLIIGVSVCTLEEAKQAESDGADYISVQSLYATQSKENVPVVGLKLLEKIVHSVSLPVIGIGGISTSNVSSVLSAGACGVAVISALSGQQDIESKARTLRKVMDQYENAN